MGKLIMVRHAESVGNRERRFTDRPGTLPITQLGRRQAVAAARTIGAMFDPVLTVTSPYARAHETGRIIASELGLAVAVEEALHERLMGRMQGRPYEAVLDDPSFDRTRPWLWRPPGGETLEEVRRRTGPVLDRLAVRYSEEDVLVVSHGGVMMSLWAHVTGGWEAVHVPVNCGIVVIEYAGGRYKPPQVIGGEPSAAPTGDEPDLESPSRPSFKREP